MSLGCADALVDQRVDLLGHPGGLVVLVVGDVALDQLAVAGVGPQVLRTPAGVACAMTGVRRLQDPLGGAVVLLQQDRGGVRVVALELVDVADRRAAEGVDRLVGVADDAQLGLRDRAVLRPDQLAHQHVLGVVGVLVLVDQHVPEPAAVVLGDVGEHLQQVHGVHDQVVEVHRVRLAQPLLVELVDLGQHLLRRRLRDVALLVDQLVLQVRDLGGEAAAGVALGVEVEVAGDHRHQPDASRPGRRS